jgi:hypothetical protein
MGIFLFLSSFNALDRCVHDRMTGKVQSVIRVGLANPPKRLQLPTDVS